MAIQIPNAPALAELLKKAESGDVAPEEIAWLAPLIDHTLLKLDATEAQVKLLCQEARAHQFGAVCVRLKFVEACVGELKGSGVKTAAVAGFPLGTDDPLEKIREAEAAIQLGAEEIDMVMQVPLLKERKLREVYIDIRQVVRACGKVPVKVILETCLLDQEEKLLACAIAKAAGAAYLKTSTGFSTGGATVEDIALLRRVALLDMGVKASGGVRTQADAIRMVLAGADRIGTSAGVTLITGISPNSLKSGVY